MIDDRAQALADLFGKHERKLLEKLTGVELGELISCGNNGCVFEASEGVIKVSYDDSEALLAKALAGPRREPFLPVFYGGWTVDGPDLGMENVFKFGVLHREALGDWRPENESGFATVVKELVDAWIAGAEPRSLRIKLPPKDQAAIDAIAGLRAWGEKNKVVFEPKEFSWEEDEDAQPGEEKILPNAITNLGVTPDGKVVIRDLGNFELGGSRRPGDRKPLLDMVKRLSSKRRNAPKGCLEIQKWLVSYLNTGLDPYDFTMFIQEWAEEALEDDDTPEEFRPGLQRAIDEDLSAGDLSPEELKRFEEWLRENDKPAEFFRIDPYGSPAYLTLDDAKALPAGTWCVHFTDATPFTAFDRGATLEGLHLSTWSRKKTFVECPKNLDWNKIGIYDVVFGFAFQASSFFLGRGTGRGPASFQVSKKYGRNAILFRTDCGVEAWHHGDEERQVIFPLCSERDLVPFEMDSHGYVTVEGDDGETITENSLERLIERIEREQEAKTRAPKRRRKASK